MARHRLTRIYTRTGDQGRTRLAGGQEQSKASARIAAYGTVDELSSVLGVVRAHNRSRSPGAAVRQELEEWLERLQHELFVAGGELATLPADRSPQMRVLGKAEWSWLEARMDQMNETLGPLTEFILPGGGILGANLHLARTVCRRAERDVVLLLEQERDGAGVVQYLNRLSDFLFVAARWVAHETGEPEQLWKR